MKEKGTTKRRLWKRMLAAILSAAMIITLMPGEFATMEVEAAADVWDGTIDTGFAGGNGTDGDPWLISTSAQLAYLASVVNDSATAATYQRRHFALTADLDLNNQQWTPIGNATSYTTRFKGIFDGQGHTISNLNVSNLNDTSSSNFFAGLFGIVEGESGFKVQIKNLNVKGNVTNSNKNGRTGGIVGCCSYTIIENCTYEGVVAATNTTTNCEGVGGILGFSSGSDSVPIISYCKNLGGSVSGGARVGGIVGRADNVTIDHCSNAADVTSSNYDAGGIIGCIFGDGNSLSYEYEIENCYNEGTITAGTVGEQYTLNAGGIIGSRRPTTTKKMKNCYNVNTDISTQGGRIIGAVAEGTTYPVEDCYFYAYGTAVIYGAGKAYSGSPGSISGSNDSNNGITSVEDWANQGTFSNWDFSTDWEMKEGMPNTGTANITTRPAIRPRVAVAISGNTEFYSLQDALDNALSGTTVILLQDVTGNFIFERHGTVVTLDLNDHVIKSGAPGTGPEKGNHRYDSVISVLAGDLTINDSAENKTTRYYYIDNDGLGHVVGSDDALYVSANDNKRGSFTGGYITGGTGFKSYKDSNNSKGGNIYLSGNGADKNGTLRIAGGTIIGGSAIGSNAAGGGICKEKYDSQFYMTGGTVVGNVTYSSTNGSNINNETGKGGGICISDASSSSNTVSITGGSIIRNTAKGGYGGGVFFFSGNAIIGGTVLIGENIAGSSGGLCARGNELNISGGNIQNNICTDESGSGGGIGIYHGTVNMSDGTVSGNTAVSGGGVCLGDGYAAFNLSGGTVSNNTATGGAGGILNTQGAATKLVISGGTITGNQASVGGGVYGKLSLSGAPVITNNTSTQFDDDNVLLLSSGMGGTPIKISGTLTNATPVGVRIMNQDPNSHELFSDTGTLTSGLSGKGDASNFTNDEEGQIIALNTTGEAYIPPVSITSGQSTVYYESLSDAISNAASGDRIKLESDLMISDATITIQKSITLDLNGKTLGSSEQGGSVIIVSGTGNTLTVTDNSTSANGALNMVSLRATEQGIINIEAGTVQLAYTVGNANINISGGTIGTIAMQDDASNPQENVTISISGGYFASDAFNYLHANVNATVLLAPGYDIETYSEQTDWAADSSAYPYRVYLAHTHEYTFSASGDTISAVCANTDQSHSGDLTTTMKISASDDTVSGPGYVYNGITVTNNTGLPVPSIVYKKSGSSGTTTTPPSEPGVYTASITMTDVPLIGGSTGSVTASTKFIIRGDTIGNDDYPYGSNMSSSSVTLNVVKSGAASYQWQKRADDASEFSDISNATSQTYTFTPEDGAWYRCTMTLNDNTVHSKAVQLLKPYASSGTSKDRYDRIWTRPYGSSSYASANWYVSNGTMAYYANGTKFDVVGEFSKNNNVYMLQTVYGGQGWQMYSSETAHQAALNSHSDSSGFAKVDDVRFAFAEDRYVLNIEADLQSGQKAFSFGCDTQLGNSATSNSYADYAALDADINQRTGTLNQITMIGAASKAAATDTDPAFVIQPLGVKSSENASLVKDTEPFVWLGRYYDRRPYKYQTVGTSTNQLTKGTLKATGINNAATGTLGTVENMVIAAQQIDTGMTMSWYDVPDGDTVKFRFSVGDVASTGAISGDVNYGNETLEGLDAGETYVVTAGGNTYTLSADSEGAIRLSGTDNNSAEFDLFNETPGLTTTRNSKKVNPITVGKVGSNDTPLTIDLAIRPVAASPATGITRADKPIEIRKDEISSTSDSVVVHFDRTSTNATVKQKISQEYRLYAANGQAIDGFGWTTPDAEGNVTIAGLSDQTEYSLKTRIPATKTRPASLVTGVNVITKPDVTLTPPVGSINKNASAAFATVSTGTAKYSKALDESYADEVPTFATAGLHTVYYRIDFASADYGYLYGSYDVIINPTVTFHAVGGTLSGASLTEEEGTKSIVYGRTIKEGIGTVSAVRTSGDLTAFAGWYADTGYTDLWDENTLAHTPVTEDVDLYAKWAQSLNTFGNTEMTGFDWTQVTQLQLFKGNIPVSEIVTVTNGAFTFTGIPDGEYELVITMKPANSNTGECRVISTLCKVKRDNINNVSIVTATPYTPDLNLNINSKLKVADDTPDILVGRLDFETRNNAVSYWDSNLQKKISESEDDPNVSYHVDLTLEAEKQFDWTKVNITDAEVAAHLSEEESTLRSAQVALMNTANDDQVSGLTYLDISVTRSVYQLINDNSEVSETLLGTDKVDSTANVLEIVIPWQTGDVVPKVYRYVDGTAVALTKITNRATDTTGYTDGTYYIGNGFVVVYSKKFSDFAIGCKSVAPNAAIGYGFVDYDTETFRNTHAIGDRIYYFSDYEISTTSTFSEGTIKSVGNIVVAPESTEQTYYIRRKAQNGIPASAYTSFKITRPNAPAEGMFTFTNSSTDASANADGVIKLNDMTAGAELQYYDNANGVWKDYLDDYPTGIIVPAALGEYQFRFKPDPDNRALSSTVLSHRIIMEIVELKSVSVSGTAKFEETLTANVTGLNTSTNQAGNPTGVTYQWYRVTGDDENGTAISGAVGSTYTLTAEDIGSMIYVVTTQTPQGGSTITKSSERTALITAADGSLEKPRLKAEDISKTHNSITINYPKTVNPGVTYEYSIDGGETWQDSNTFSGLQSEQAYIPMVREKGKEETVNTSSVETVKPGVSSDPITIITDENEIDVGSVTVLNMSTNDASDTTVECGDTLKAVAIQRNGKPISGASYQWMRANTAGGLYGDITGAIGETYTPGTGDLGKYLKVTVTKNNNVTSEATGPVVKAVSAIATDISALNTSVRITSTDTTITVTGLKNDTLRGIYYEYGIRAAGSEGEFFWQDGSTFTGLTASSSSFTSQYEVVVRIKETATREEGPVSEPRVVTMQNKGMPFNAGLQTAVVVMQDYVYGITPPVPTLNIQKNADSGETAYYYSSDAKNWSLAAEGKLPDGNDSLAAGTYYIKAVIAESVKYDRYETGIAVFHVLKASATTDINITQIDPDTRSVSLENASDKELEYVVIPNPGSLTDAVWSRVVLADDGSFTINKVLPAGGYTVYVREKESDNYEASSPVSGSFTLTTYSVVYDANGGVGTVPETAYGTTGYNVNIQYPWTQLSRTGYDFGGWSDNPKADNSASALASVNSAKKMYAIWVPHTYRIVFETGDGNPAISAKEGIRYGDRVVLPIGTHSDNTQSFMGWAVSEEGNVIYAGNEVVKNLIATNDGTVTLYARWTVSTGEVSGDVSSDEGSDSTIRLMQGNTQWGESKVIAMNLTNSGYSGTFSFTNVPYGEYNLVIEQEVTDDNGVVIEVLTKTIKVTVNSATVSFTADQLRLPVSARSKLIVVGDDTPAAVVAGLDEVAEGEAGDIDADGTDTSVTVTMNIEKKEEQLLGNEAPEEDIDTQTAISAIKDMADISNDPSKEQLYLDISLNREIIQNGVVIASDRITDLSNINNLANKVLEIILPFNVSGRSNHIFMFNYHDNAAKPLTMTTKTYADSQAKNSLKGMFYVDEEKENIHVFGSEYSVYAIIVNEDIENTAYSGGGTGGGGGGAGTTGFTPVIPASEHGTVTIEPASPVAGDTVTIKPSPEEGFETDEVKVTDKNGNPVEVTKKDDGTYTFTQPSSGPVNIEVTFKPESTKPVIAPTEHGTVTASPDDPKAGDVVTITVNPEGGYETAGVVVTDSDGNPVAVTKNDDGTYSFVQPAKGHVNISVTFVPAGSITVTFDLNGKPGTAPGIQVIDAEHKTAVRPTPDPSANGYRFTGWFVDKECTTEYNFATEVTESIIIYAGWEKKAAPGPDMDEDFGIWFAELYDDPYEGVFYNGEADRYEIIYTGEPIRPLIMVTSKAEGELREGVDYTVSYSNNKKVSKKKPAVITVKGKGSFTGKKTLELYILPADLQTAYDKGMLALEDEIRVQSGKKLNPVITYCGIKLKSSDRTLSNTSAITSDGSVSITGKGNFTGTLKDVAVKVITKDDVKNGAIKAVLRAGSHVYNGAEQELTITTPEAAGELTVTAGSSKTPLEKDTDFIVSYSANINAGTAKVTIIGIGDKNGTVVKTFKITPDKASTVTAKLADPDTPVNYSPKGAMPDVEVQATVKDDKDADATIDLVKGKDYRISYSNNKKVGNAGYTVTFMGNYKGHAPVKDGFTIVQAPLEGAKVEAAQMLYKKPGKYFSRPFVSVDGVQLKTSDYTFRYYEGVVTDVSAPDVKELTSKDKITFEADETSRTITIAVTAKGNFTGMEYGSYEVVKPEAGKLDLSKAKIVAKAKSAKGKDVKVGKQEYTGYAIEPEIRVLVKQGSAWTEVDDSKYEISYINNVMKGKATILVTGNGTDAVGSRTAKFSIKTMRMDLFKLIFGK